MSDRQVGRQGETVSDRQTGRGSVRPTDRPTDRQTDRQGETETDVQQVTVVQDDVINPQLVERGLTSGPDDVHAVLVDRTA